LLRTARRVRASSFDATFASAEDMDMSEITREELDARIGAVVARIDARFVEAQAHTDARFAELREEMNARFAELREEMNARFAEVQARTDARIADLREEMITRFAEAHTRTDARFTEVQARTDARFAEARIQTDAGFAELRQLILTQEAKLQKTVADLIKWAVAAGIAATTVMVAVMAIVITNAASKPQAPIVITVPAPAVHPQ
jgi:DNA anti-recombination protein RmuC